MTERLHHADAFLRRSRPQVVAHGAHAGRPSLVLAAEGRLPAALEWAAALAAARV